MIQHQLVLLGSLRRRESLEQVVDLGFVGEPAEVDTSVIDTAVAAGMIPVSLLRWQMTGNDEDIRAIMDKPNG